MSTRPNSIPIQRVMHVEREIHKDLGSPANFLPFLALHEFEAWLFSSRNELPNTLTQPDRGGDFAAIRESFEDPEQIDEGLETAPSKRIARLFPDYRKPLHGALAAKRIGVATIRAQCPHFDAWYCELERLATE